jgi:hypothetical protein
MPPVQLSVVFARYDREKHRRALRRLLDTLDRLTSANPFVVVVDNARPGDWIDRRDDGVMHVGGDGWAREFSAFDRGVSVLEATGRRSDVVALVTDSVLTHGEQILDLVDDHALACCHQLQACVGWIDSWGQDCSIADLGFDAWLRTCFVLVPAGVLLRLTPLAADLGPLRLFGDDPTRPFSTQAEISPKVEQCLTEWLTTRRFRSPYLRWRWHLQFDLGPDTWRLFQAKASAILREQLLSARLQRLGIPGYGLRCVRGLANCGDLGEFLDRGGHDAYQWLGGVALAEGAPAAPPPSPREASGPRISAVPGPEPLFVLEGDPDEPRSREAAAYFKRRVLPLIRQRFSGSGFRVAGAGPRVAPAAVDQRPRISIRLGEAPRRAAPLTAARIVPPTSPGSGPSWRPLASLSLDEGRDGPSQKVFVHDGSPSGIARVCCQLLEDAGR